MFASHPEEIELRLKAELDEAEQQLRNANPHERDEARRRFKQALHDFRVLVLDGKAPLNLVPTRR